MGRLRPGRLRPVLPLELVHQAYYEDDQTGNATSYFYGQFGNTLLTFSPDYPNLVRRQYAPGWDPVWSIRNC
ncbi:hypothetical protein [Hamadaea tsunoensis]|uniref:hypothetical protein n=1 Tax=Hamadaea tsunoensis TaxID=53368 RepID=UPI0003FCD53F|nr:hypothetical protein [Hamadaea tsunoensis]